MHTHRNLVIGVFETLQGMETALESLRGQGFRNSDISVLAPEAKGGAHHFACIQHPALTDAHFALRDDLPRVTRRAERPTGGQDLPRRGDP